MSGTECIVYIPDYLSGLSCALFFFDHLYRNGCIFGSKMNPLYGDTARLYSEWTVGVCSRYFEVLPILCILLVITCYCIYLASRYPLGSAPLRIVQCWVWIFVKKTCPQAANLFNEQCEYQVLTSSSLLAVYYWFNFNVYFFGV